ncbi:ABC transporter permease [Pseudoflavonifractor sp. MSJ-37]|uniref:ABC transporter permease n=1 Tax=Pseudoflavonifractor sp. MSJ-37 TaxID=2841531 RepID=UPI001C105E67|nr:ABC transporter permease [Pseudoflavonifractor sp. MSJ-37]MBU5434131.1 ABC transporter permease [Pseudoflavonifractor sp. MSJ-37]
MDQLSSFLAATIRMAIPLLIAALGLLVSERSGLMNIGVEGTMLSGAFAAFSVAYYTNNYWLGMLAGMLAGCFMTLVFAVAAIKFRAPQVVIGCAINMLGSGFTAVLFRKMFFDAQTGGTQVKSFPSLQIPGLSSVPLLGETFFSHNIIVYIGILMVPAIWFLMNRTSIGTRIIAVGEHPKAADSLGINVFVTRYAAALFSGLLMGMAGAYLAIAQSNTFQVDMTGGKGYIAMAVVVLGKWRALGVLAGALIFGGANALQMTLQNAGLNIPNNLILMVPYIVTVLAVLAACKQKAIDASAKGVPYEKA